MALDAEFKGYMDDLKTEVTGLYKESDKKNADLAEQIDALKSKMASGDDLTDIKTTIDEQKADNQKLYDLMDKVEKKQQIGNDVPCASIGDMMLKSGAFNDLNGDSKGTWSHVVEAKEISNLTNTQASPARNVLVAEQNAGFLNPIDQPLMVRGLIPAGQTSSDTIERTEEDVFTNNAGMVAEGALKPESDITFKRGSLKVEKIAHWIKVSAEALSDAAMLRSYINMRLTYGVNFKEEEQLVNGDDTSPNLDGFLNAGNFTAYNNALIAGVTPVDGVDDLRIAKEQVNQSYLTATGVIMNHLDWARVELLKDGDGKYLHSSITSGLAPRLWGMRVAPSHAIAQGQFHVGSFAMGAQIWDRWAMRLMASTEDGDNFVRNKVTLLAEKRLALEIYRPDAFVSGSFT